ncbi:hypothetical protein [Burkholderia stagnalis]
MRSALEFSFAKRYLREQLADFLKAALLTDVDSASGKAFRAIVSIHSTIDCTCAMVRHNIRCEPRSLAANYAFER